MKSFCINASLLSREFTPAVLGVAVAVLHANNYTHLIKSIINILIYLPSIRFNPLSLNLIIRLMVSSQSRHYFTSVSNIQLDYTNNKKLTMIELLWSLQHLRHNKPPLQSIQLQHMILTFK